MHFSCIATFNDETYFGSLLRANEMMMHCARHEQRRNWREHFIAVAIGQHNKSHTSINCRTDLATNLCKRRTQTGLALGNSEEAAHHHAAQVCVLLIVIDVNDLCQVVVVNHRKRQHQLSTMLGGCIEQVALGSYCGAHRCHYFLADCIKRRISYLCKQLLEIVEQQTWSR